MKNVVFLMIMFVITFGYVLSCSKTEETISTPDPQAIIISVDENSYTTANLLTALQEEVSFQRILTAWAQENTEAAPSPISMEKDTVESILKETGDALAFHDYYADKARELKLDQTKKYNNFINDIVNNELYEKLLIEEILNTISFTEEELRQYYEQNINRYKMKDSDRFVLSGFYVKTDDKTNEEAWGKIQEAHEKLKAGEDFAAVSIAYSEAPFETRGMIQEINLDDFNNSEIPRTLAKLKDGEFSDIIPSSNKLLIYKRHQYKPPKYVPFSAQKEEVHELAAIEQRDRELAKLNQKLVDQYKPSVFPELLLNHDDQNQDIHILSLPGVFEMTLKDFLAAATKARKNSYHDQLQFLDLLVNKTVMLAEARSRGWDENSVASIVDYHTNKWLTKEFILSSVQNQIGSEAQFQQIYESNRDHEKFTIPKKYDLYYVFFPAVFSLEQTSLETENNFLRAQQLAFQAHEELKNGADFQDIVSTYSTDPYLLQSKGYLGNVTLSQLIPQRSGDIAEEDLQAGEFSEPHEVYQHSTGRYGYEIYYVKDIEPERQMSFDEAKMLLKQFAENDLYTKERNKLLDEWETIHTLQYHATVVDQVIEYLIDIAQKPDIRQASIYRYTQSQMEDTP